MSGAARSTSTRAGSAESSRTRRTPSPGSSPSSRIATAGVDVRVENLGSGRPTVVSADHPVAQAAIAALEATFGTTPHLIRGGGSIPVAEIFDRVLDRPPILLGFANPDSRAHAPNE